MATDLAADELAPREPTVEDLRDLCRELNRRDAKYVVIGGFAIRAANYVRSTMDIDLLVAADSDNEPGSIPLFPRCPTTQRANLHQESFRTTA